MQTLGAVNEILIDPGLLLKVAMVRDATFISATSSTKNKAHTLHSEMHLSKAIQ